MTGKGPLILLIVETLLMHDIVNSVTTPSANFGQGLVHQEVLQLVTADLTQIKTEIFQMNGELKTSMNQVRVVTEENQLLKSKISEMQVELDMNQRNQSDLRNMISTMQIASDNRQRNYSLTEAELTSKIANLENRMNAVGSVVFMLQFKDVSHVTNDAVLKYDDVILDVGGGYNPNTGIYTCPTAGLYLLSVRCSVDWKSSGRSAVWGTLYRNGNTLITCNADEDEHAESDFVQMSVFLDKGDELLVRQQYINAKEIADATWTFFSGVLLVPKE